MKSKKIIIPLVAVVGIIGVLLTPLLTEEPIPEITIYNTTHNYTVDLYNFENTTKALLPVIDGCVIEHYQSNGAFAKYTGFDIQENVLYKCGPITMSAGVQVGDYMHNIMTSLDVASQLVETNPLLEEHVTVNGHAGQFIVYEIDHDANPESPKQTIMVLTWVRDMDVKIYSSFNTGTPTGYWDGERDETLYPKVVHNFVTMVVKDDTDYDKAKEFLYRFT